ncbi:MAG: hypothetical protein JNL88_10925 [Bacteroidia bacterium]|nr:hypothetical protein [Bacteroidia bacterium]
MPRDFTLHKYKSLLHAFIRHGYQIIAYEDLYKGHVPEKYVIMRHDVDALPEQSLEKAKIERELGVRSTYYFRIVPESNDPDTIRQIAALGHEIGYHYEDLSLANGNFRKAIKLFEKNLEYFRTFYPIQTICMHGSPASIWDNRLIWRDHHYKNYHVIAEPYFDIDFNSTLYLTDTGRKWDGNRVSVRDKVKNPFQQNFHFRSTNSIIRGLEQNQLPAKIMITTHPQRWHNAMGPWLKELILQNIKNKIKKYFYVSNPMSE